MKRVMLVALLSTGAACGSRGSVPPAPGPVSQVEPTGLKITPPRELGTVDLNVTVDDPSRASDNRRAIQEAIEKHAGKGMVLQLPAGTIYVDRAGMDSIRFSGAGTTDLTLAGKGLETTRIVIQGDAGRGLWLGIHILDGARRIALRDFAIEQGTIDNRSPTQQNHLVQINGWHAVTGDVHISNIHFGPCIGDAVRIAGTAPSYAERILLHDFTMQTNGQKQSPKEMSRSGLSFQRGFRDVEVYNFYIYGARGSGIDMEPTGAALIERLDIHDGVVDNAGGDTAYAVSLGGSEDPQHVVTPFVGGKLRNVMIFEGILNILNTADLEISNVTIYTSGRGPMARFGDPLLYVNRENKNIRFDQLHMVRDAGTAAGPLVLVNHGVDTYTSNISFTGGEWVSRVDSGGRPPAYVSFVSTQHLKMHDVKLRAHGTNPAGQFGIRFRSGGRDIAHVDLDKVSIDAPSGNLKAGIWFAATNNHEVREVKVTNVDADMTAETGLLLDAAPGSKIAAPTLKGNAFRGSQKQWDAINGAVHLRTAPTVTPVPSP